MFDVRDIFIDDEGKEAKCICISLCKFKLIP